MRRDVKKLAGYMISDELYGQKCPNLISVQFQQDVDGRWTITQVECVRKLTLSDLVLSVLPWPFHKDLPKLGST